MYGFSMRLLTLLLAACIVNSCSTNDSATNQVSSIASVSSSSIVSSASSATSVAYKHSMEQFMQQEFIGANFELGDVLQRNSAYTRYQIFYTSNGLRISGVMNIPTGDGPYPLLILNHGYIDPAVYTNGRGLKREQDYLARNGYAVLHTDYRNYAFSDADSTNDSRFRNGYAADAITAALAVQAANLPTVDASQVGMLGHSMGGGVTLKVLAARPDLFSAAVLFAPVSSNEQQNFERWTTDRPEVQQAMQELYGSNLTSDDFWYQVSVASQLTRIAVPVQNHHGTQDDSVPLDWSEQLENALTAAGVQNELFIYEGEPHEFVQAWPTVMQRTLGHFDQHMKATTVAEDWQWPLNSAEQRLTKKPFGLFVTPTNSPVENEIFTGFHTGVDLELLPNEVASELTVQAVCTGPIVEQKWVSGYGGVVLQECVYNQQTITVLYGHIAIDSVTAANQSVLTVGDNLAVLGQGFSQQTDGERPHLHLSLVKGSRTELRGYVQTEAELTAWLNPTEVLSAR